ncbi:hypothetical protein [Streptomyces sp. IBSBF 2806]|uniref:hypothetical protein n=1 Tax=Streptomyces sp. IBSBF 2806 TaxID=2903529 RepID=UPI002FDBDBE6
MHKLTTNPAILATAICPQAEVRPRGEAAPTDPAREHPTTDTDRVIAVLPEAIAQAMRTAIPELYTPELAAQFAETMAAELRQTPQADAACTIWPGLCTETGEHDDHANHQLSATETGWPVSIGFVDLGSHPLLYVDTGMAADFDPEDAPKVAAQLRAAAAALEDMQRKVNAARNPQA